MPSRPLRERPQAEAAVVLVRGLDHAQAFAQAAHGHGGGGRLRQRALEKAANRFEALRGHGERARAAFRAHASSGLCREADERFLLPARGAPGEVREVAREPEQLQLKREDERVERRLGGQRRLDVVEKVEEARERIEGGRVRVLLDEEAEHSLEADVAHRHAVAVDAPALVGAQKVGAPHCAQLSPPLVQHELDMAKGLEASPEARFRLADTLRDRTHPAALEGVEVEDAIRLGKADRTQYDGLRLEGSGHAPTLAAVPVESRGSGYVE